MTQMTVEDAFKQASQGNAGTGKPIVSPKPKGKRVRTQFNGSFDKDVSMEKITWDVDQITEVTKLSAEGFFRYCGNRTIRPVMYPDLEYDGKSDKKKNKRNLGYEQNCALGSIWKHLKDTNQDRDKFWKDIVTKKDAVWEKATFASGL